MASASRHALPASTTPASGAFGGLFFTWPLYRAPGAGWSATAD